MIGLATASADRPPYLHVGPGSRDAFVSAHQDLVRRARQAPGCLDPAISADPARNVERDAG